MLAVGVKVMLGAVPVKLPPVVTPVVIVIVDKFVCPTAVPNKNKFAIANAIANAPDLRTIFFINENLFGLAAGVNFLIAFLLKSKVLVCCPFT